MLLKFGLSEKHSNFEKKLADLLSNVKTMRKIRQLQVVYFLKKNVAFFSEYMKFKDWLLLSIIPMCMSQIRGYMAVCYTMYYTALPCL